MGAIFSVVQVLLIDWHPGKGASVTGCKCVVFAFIVARYMCLPRSFFLLTAT
jgi:hypothetical protein